MIADTNRKGVAGIGVVLIVVAVTVGVGFFLARPFQKEISQDAALKEKAIALIKSEFPKDKYPYMYFVPRSTIITAPKDSNAYPLSDYLGLQFRTLQRGQLTEQTKKSSVIKQIVFPKSEKITISYAGTSTPREQLSADVNSGMMRQFEDAFGNKLNSGYDFKSYVYSSSPDMLTTSMSLREIEARGKAIAMKSTMSLFSSDEFYNFEMKNVRGFWGKSGSSTLIEMFFGSHLYDLFILTPQPTNNDEASLIISSARRVE